MGRNPFGLFADGNGSRDGVRARVDERGRPVELVAHPHAVLADGDPTWTVTDRNRCHDRVTARIDARDGAVEVVRNPDRPGSYGNAHGIVADIGIEVGRNLKA